MNKLFSISFLALIICSFASLNSCKKTDDAPTSQEVPIDEIISQAQELIAASMREELQGNRVAAMNEVTFAPVQEHEDGSLNLAAQVNMELREDIYRSELAPAQLNELRRECNMSINAAMQPEAYYLMQVGAPTSTITEADRIATPLPSNLQQIADRLKEQAESPYYNKEAAKGTPIIVNVSARLSKDESGDWNVDEFIMRRERLTEMEEGLLYSELPQDALIASPELLNTRSNNIREIMSEFQQNAEPYIKGREEKTRQRRLETLAKQEEEIRKTEELETQARENKAIFTEQCMKRLSAGMAYAGDWKRDETFGKITLKITKSDLVGEAVHFIGSLSDTDLPEASLDVSGRCTIAPLSETQQVLVTLYDGAYVEHQPTAEVYSSDDGVLILTLSKEGDLEGDLTCTSWAEKPEKSFKVKLLALPAPKKAEPQKGKRKR